MVPLASKANCMKKVGAKVNSSMTEQKNKELEATERGQRRRNSRVQCKACFRYGHIASPRRDRSKRRTEALGRSVIPRALVTTSELTDEQLQEEIARRKLCKEQDSLDSVSTIQVVTGGAVGPVMVMDVSVEGVKVKGVVDTGSQSTIISRKFLHSIKRHLLKEGKAIPDLNQVVW